MMLIDNRNILRIKNRSLLESLSKLEESGADESIIVEPSRKGVPTLKIEVDGKQQYIHSKYDPQAEAERLINQIENLANYDHVFFIGTGLGYHIEAVRNAYPSKKFTIFEPNEAVLLHYLSHQMLQEKNLEMLITSDSEQTLQQAASQLVKTVGNNIYVFTLPAYKKMYAQQEKQILSVLKNTLKDKRSNIATNAAFQKRWTINSIKNFPKVLTTPNILHDVDRTAFQGKPAIIVAAGPSLNGEFDNLRYIKEHGLAYIFSVGSAINALIEHGIYPDVACTYDPTEKNQFVIQKVKDKEIKDIPLIFGSSVGHETLENYPGDMFHMITSQDTISPQLLDTTKAIDIVLDAPSIAVVTLQLLTQLGCYPIILAGQNLGYRADKRYAAGIHYDFVDNKLSEQEKKDALTVKDVYGNEIETNDGFNRMRKQLELHIRPLEKGHVMNTTKGGAHIEGTVFQPLESVIKKFLTSPIEKQFIQTTNSYDLSFTKNKLKKLINDEKKCQSALQESFKELDKINQSVENRRQKNMEQRFARFDKHFNKLKKNPYYIGFIEPMVRVQNERLSEQTQSIRYETDVLRKGQVVVDVFTSFLKECELHISFVQPYFEELQQELEKIFGKGEQHD